MDIDNPSDNFYKNYTIFGGYSYFPPAGIMSSLVSLYDPITVYSNFFLFEGNIISVSTNSGRYIFV